MLAIKISPSINAQLKRSNRRKTIGIKVHRGKVTISAPKQAPLRDIQYFIQKKAPWIERHLARQQKCIADHQEKQYEQGDTLFYLGERITLESSTKPVVCLGQDEGILNLPEVAYETSLQERKQLIEGWYIEQALNYLPEKVTQYAKLMAVEPQGIKIRYYKSRWGSCNRRGQLQFNWIIMMAPAEIVDYVIVHELAHLRYFNHSPPFWQLVESILANHKNSRAWLNTQDNLVW